MQISEKLITAPNDKSTISTITIKTILKQFLNYVEKSQLLDKHIADLMQIEKKTIKVLKNYK